MNGLASGDKVKITKKQLNEMIQETVKRKLFESTESKKAWERRNFLKDKHGSDFYLLDKYGTETLETILSLRDQAKTQLDFSLLVGPGKYSSMKGHYEKTNEFLLSNELVANLWHRRIGAKPVGELNKLKSEFDKLDSRFKKFEVTSETDHVYGRRRFEIVDMKTGAVVAAEKDRHGTLGT